SRGKGALPGLLQGVLSRRPGRAPFPLRFAGAWGRRLRFRLLLRGPGLGRVGGGGLGGDAGVVALAFLLEVGLVPAAAGEAEAGGGHLAADGRLAALGAGLRIGIGQLLQAVELVAAGVAGEGVARHGAREKVRRKDRAPFWGLNPLIQAHWRRRHARPDCRGRHPRRPPRRIVASPPSSPGSCWRSASSWPAGSRPAAWSRSRPRTATSWSRARPSASWTPTCWSGRCRTRSAATTWPRSSATSPATPRRSAASSS